VKLRAYAGLFAAYGRSLRAANVRLRALPLPPADAAGLTGWLDGRGEAGGAYLAAGRAGERGKYKRMFGKLFAAATIQREAERLVKGYGFRRCAEPDEAPKL
jgi:hypothetical protein